MLRAPKKNNLDLKMLNNDANKAPRTVIKNLIYIWCAEHNQAFYMVFGEHINAEHVHPNNTDNVGCASRTEEK